MLVREIVTTKDGSVTIYLPEWNESYHSKHGAIQEAYHVFINNGLRKLNLKHEISILELGFGTGLNALITLAIAQNENLKINFTTLEKYPVGEEEYKKLNHPKALKNFDNELGQSEDELNEVYLKLMNSKWEELQTINENFKLKKVLIDFLDYDFPENQFDLIYFDAFGARVQPELWTETLFDKIFKSTKKNGIFTTYSAKGSVRRALKEVGYQVEKKPGPPGKREMLIGIKV